MSKRPPSTLLLVMLGIIAGCANPKNGTPALTRSQSFAELVSLMQKVEAAAPDERPALLDRVKQRLPAWYSGLELDPPDMSNLKWPTVVAYDLMPEERFQKKVAETRELFEVLGMHFPKHVTRRQLQSLIESLMSNMGE